MATFAEALAGAIKTGFCEATSAADRYYSIFQNLLPESPLLQLPSFPGALNAIFCNRDPENLPQNEPPPFSGGQCDTVQYEVTSTFSGELRLGSNWFPIGPTTTTTPCLQGPIRGAGWRVRTDGATALIFHGNNQENVRFDSSGGEEYRDLQITIDSVTPCGGASDDCGDPPSPPPNTLPPGSNTTSTSIEYNDETNNVVTIPIVLVYGTATVNVKGEITIPIDVQIGPNTLEVNLNLNTGDINFGPSYTTNNPGVGTGGRGTLCECEDFPEIDEEDDPGQPGTGIPTPSPTEPPESNSRKIVGAIVVVTDGGVNVGEVNGDAFEAPDIGVPRFGDLFFEVEVSGRTAWLNDIPVKTARAFIPCPFEGGANRIAGIPKPGVAWSIVPVYSKVRTPRQTLA